MTLKLALISHSFPPLLTGGIGSYTFNLAEALSKKGVDVTVFCGGKVKKELKCSFKIKRWHMLDFLPHTVWFQLQNYRKFAKELENFDIIHGQNTSSTLYAFLKNKIKKPWIVTFHDCPTRGLNAFFGSPRYTKNLGDLIFNVVEYPLYKKLYSIDLKKSDKIISVSYSLADDLKKNFGFDRNKLEVIQNGIDLERIKKLIKNLEKKETNKTRLLFFGRLFYGKGITFLIEAMEEVVRHKKDIFLDIYGEGPLKNVIEKQIKRYSLSNYIILNNFLPNQQMIKEVVKSDIVILPSLYESFPLVFLEAMACSKPLITFDYPFSREIIEDGKDGILVEAKNTQKLVEAILKLVKDKELREKLGEEAFKTVKQKFDNSKVVDKYVKVYRSLLE